MNVGDIIDVHLRPEDAYGMPDPEAIIKAPLADMPGAENLEVGNQVYLANSMGQQFLVKVIEKMTNPSHLMQTMRWPAKSSTSR